MGLIDEILHYVVSLYMAQVQPLAFSLLLGDLEKNRATAPCGKP